MTAPAHWHSNIEIKARLRDLPAAREVAEAVKAAWIDVDVAQCGYCQPGQIMSATALLTKNAGPDQRAIEQAMNGNLCRCATYERIFRAKRFSTINNNSTA